MGFIRLMGDATIRDLIRQEGGHLAQNIGAAIVREKHPTRRRDELRERIAALNSSNKPGPHGPRKIVRGNVRTD